MAWNPDSISPEQMNELRQAAEKAWGDDTRNEGFVGHPDPSQGHCFVTAQWLAHKLGGYVGAKKGHFFWVSPDKKYVMDLCGDWFSHPVHQQPGPVMFKRATHSMWKGFRIMDDYPEHPRAQLFERRANAALHHLSRVSSDEQVMYHVAPADARESIGQNGLDATRSAYDRWSQGTGIHGFTDLDEAKWYQQMMSTPHPIGFVEPEDAGPMDIWEAQPHVALRADSGLTSSDEPSSAVYHSEPIPPERIRRVAKTADLAGPTPYTGETPQQQEDWNLSAPLIHDEPGFDMASGDHTYQWIVANNQVHVSPAHSQDELAGHAQFDLNSTEPFAAGQVEVKDGHATWSVTTNISMRLLSNLLRGYSETVGWKFDGLVDPMGQEVHDDFGAHKSMYYSERKDGHLVMSETPLPHGKRVDIQGKTARVGKVTEGLQEWAEDFGYRLAEWPGGGDMTDQMKTREHLDEFNRGDMKFQPERSNPDLDIENADLSCGKCGEEFDSMAALRMHHRDHEPHDEPLDQAKFPWPHDFDAPLGFGTQQVPQSQWDGTVAMVLPSWKVASRYPQFGQQIVNVWNDDWRFYGAYRSGQLIGYAAVDDRGLVGALHTMRPDDTERILRLIQTHYEAGSVLPCNKAQERLLPRLGMVPEEWPRGIWKWAKGQEPKDLISAQIPFVYDVQGNKDHRQGMISLGYPGQGTHEVMPRGGEKFTPGGIVEGIYEPGGKVTFISQTNVPWTTRQFAQLWYALYPQMEITSVERQMPDGSSHKLAAESVGNYLKTLLASDEAAYKAYQALRDVGGKVYVVGGAIRDALQQRQPQDLDLMVAGLPSEKVDHVLSSLPGRMDLTGKRFGVYRYRVNGQEVEVALPREDKYETARRGLGQITVDHNLPVEQDLARRDFTANSMAVDLDTGQLIDPAGGAKDLERNVLRTTHDNSFREDPTRLVRALVAHSRFGLNPDERTRQAMADDGHLLRHESPDALNKVLDKLFTSHHPASALRLAKETGVLDHLFPEVAQHWDYDQGNPHHKHVLGEHLLETLDNASRITDDPDIRMAALYHDVGKPHSAWQDENGVSHYYENAQGQGADHELIGAQMAEDRMRALNYPVARINRVKSLVQGHMYPAFSSPKGARRFLQKYEPYADDLLTLRQADMYGKGFSPEEAEINRTPVARMQELVDQARKAQEPTDLQNIMVNGNDLINLGMTPGPQVGMVLRQLLDHVVEVPQDNNRERLLTLAEQYRRALPE